ncbi:MAG: hypothetical protein JNK07_08205 [Alphaproteobacteria bacterium]|nr:hypothetical protein [Alphaproteobacteria bacterium]
MSKLLRAAAAAIALVASAMPAWADIPPDTDDLSRPIGVALIAGLVAGGIIYFYYRSRRE